MRDGGMPSCLGGAAFEHHNRLESGHLPGHLQKASRPLDAFKVHDDRTRVWIFGQILEGVTLVYIDLVPQTDNPANAEMLGRQDAFHGMGGKIACLCHIGYLAGSDPAEGEKRGSEPVRR